MLRNGSFNYIHMYCTERLAEAYMHTTTSLATVDAIWYPHGAWCHMAPPTIWFPYVMPYVAHI